jgi:hypothetical protein
VSQYAATAMTVRSRRWVAPVLAVGLVVLACAAPAGAQTATVAPGSSTAASPTLQTLPGGLVRPGSQDVAPPGRVHTATQILDIARRVPKVRTALREHPDATGEAFLKGPGRWQASYIVDRGGMRTEVAQVVVDDLSGAVLEAWTGYQVPWTMARGYAGAFGRAVNSPWVWLPLCVLFAVPFVDLRNPWRMLHLDLLVLSGFSVALAFFNAARVGISTPMVVPLLVYLLARMLQIGLGRGDPRPRRPLPLMVPASWLAIAAVFLVGFRIGLNVTDSNVIDVGYAGVIGADHITGGEPLYGGFPSQNEHGDTYGPVTYLAYVPFELALPWSGSWDDLPAAHAAALVFDLLVVAALYVLGRRIRGPRTGIVLAYTWIAFPFSLFVSNTNANDALPAALVLAGLLAIAHPAGRGALIALAGLTKFAPLVLVPLFARARGSLARFALGFVLVALVACIPIVLHGGTLREFWDATLGYQADRGSPFAIYGLWGGLDWLRAIVGVGAAALAVAVAFVPRRRDLVGLAALSAAVLIAVQLWLSYWFFLYLAWIAPLVFIALLAREGEPAR